MLFEPGDKVHVITRRNFDGDLRRHYVGEIEGGFETTARIRGYVFMLDTARNEFVRKPEERTTIIDLAESGYIVNVLPRHVDVEELTYSFSDQQKLVVTDNRGFSLDINEFGHNR